MGKHVPETSCNGTLLTYELPASDVQAAKRQVTAIAGDKPVVFMEIPLADGMVELTVMAASLTPSQTADLMALQQDMSSIRRISKAEFNTEVSFGESPGRRRR